MSTLDMLSDNVINKNHGQSTTWDGNFIKNCAISLFLMLDVSFSLGAANDVRPEHPRPDFQRDIWACLNGVWDFDYDPGDVGVEEKWYANHEWPLQIIVPFVHQSKLSGLGDTTHYKQVWYNRTFMVPLTFQGKRVRLNIGAADYHAIVWVNGIKVGSYEGGYTPFSFDITDFIKENRQTANRLTVRVFDDPFDPAQPRGKQRPKGRNRWHYTHLTGIWQSVWIEAVPELSIESFKVVTEISPCRAKIEVAVPGASQGSTVTLSLAGEKSDAMLKSAKAPVVNGVARFDIRCPEAHPWSPEHPRLYSLKLELIVDGRLIDMVKSYIGFREIAVRDGKVFLNRKPIWLSGALDQGYYQDGLYTAPSDSAFEEDVRWAKRYGLNVVRKHQMVPDPRYLYHCDRLGLLVWGEMANAAENHFSKRAAQIALREWKRVIRRDRNHPCIIAWVYSNEAWMHGRRDSVEMEHYVAAYRQLKKWDATRPVIDTSGWSHVCTDILDLHGARYLAELQKWVQGETANLSRRVFWHDDILYAGQPIIVSEWTPGDFNEKTPEQWLQQYEAQLITMVLSPICAGQIYTQLYDIENELNGYVTYGRKPKIAPQRIRELHARAEKLHWYVQGIKEIIAVLPIAIDGGYLWRYTFEQAPEGWEQPDFDDSSWKQGSSGFGNTGTRAGKIGTEWVSKQIWLRTTFNAKEERPHALVLDIFHTHDVTVYWNGKQIFKETGYGTFYYRKLLDSKEILKVWTPGKNTIAVKCQVTNGDRQYVDLGLEFIKEASR